VASAETTITNCQMVAVFLGVNEKESEHKKEHSTERRVAIKEESD
jgi:hypothetical protein